MYGRESASRKAPQPQLRGLEKKMMNRFLKGRRAAPWAWMQTGPLTVDAERLAAVAAERIPASDHTLAAEAAEAVVQAERTDLPTEEAEPPIEDIKLTLDDFPALKAAME